MLSIFITSDYDNFIVKLNEYKSCNPIIKEYFKYCSKEDGIKTLLRIIKDDILLNFIEQYKIKNKS
jgi:hypothetical protein